MWSCWSCGSGAYRISALHDCDLSGRLLSLHLAFDQLIVRAPVGLDQHVVDVAGQHVAFFGDAGLKEAAMTQMAREAQR